MANYKPLKIDSYEGLRQNQDEIVKRINDTPSGGSLYLIDPLRLLKYN